MISRGVNNSQNFNSHSFRKLDKPTFLKIKDQDILRQTLSNLDSQNKASKSMLNNWEKIEGNKKLLTGLSILKDQQLLEDKNINMNINAGLSRVRFVYNDYHQKNTNPGYSRNSLGCYYTR